MKSKKRFVFVAVMVACTGLVLARICAQSDIHPHIMEKFSKAVEKFKTICEKNPNCVLGETVDMQTLNTHINTNSIINIGRKFEQNKQIGPLARKIKSRLDNQMQIIQKYLVEGNEEYCSQFERLLKKSAIKSSGFIWALRNRSTCEAAVFAAVAKFLETKNQ